MKHTVAFVLNIFVRRWKESFPISSESFWKMLWYFCGYSSERGREIPFLEEICKGQCRLLFKLPTFSERFAKGRKRAHIIFL